ncbi:2487_t:CDS:2 [Entrophospora sp. SA101]|nr:2487_t:CDS:2 [Entrophospora sp. SA101]
MISGSEINPNPSAVIRLLDRESILLLQASRPANSERSLKQHNPPMVDYLFDVNKKFNDLKKKSSKDQHQQDHDNNIIQIVDLNEINKDEDFVEFLKMRNMKIAIKQTEAIEDILKYVNDPNLKPPNQDEYKRLCLLEWGLSFDEFDDEDEQQEMEEDNPYDIAY